jgi:1-acyl-sn-glycerol-3-phosphate acyltransferase
VPFQTIDSARRGAAPTFAQRLLLAFFRLVVSTFFRRIEVVGADRVPAGGPVIFVANHPNALVDGALLLTTCGRSPVHFMCNAKLWRYPLLPLMLNCLGGVPVQRRGRAGAPWTTAPFDRLFDSLESGISIGIFPEGVSHAASQMTRLKTGAARIALGVAAAAACPSSSCRAASPTFTGIAFAVRPSSNTVPDEGRRGVAGRYALPTTSVP